MDDTCGKQFEDINKVLEECISNPEIFIEPQPDTAKKFISFTKLVYDESLKCQNDEKIKTKSLPKLLTKGFDEEQIWQQIELRNEDALKYFKDKLLEFSKLISKADIIKNDVEGHPVDADSYSDVDSDGGYVFDDDDSDSEVDTAPQLEKPESENEELTSKQNKSDTSVSRRKDKHPKSSEVDDQFFNLSKMEQFLKLEDLREERGGLSSGDESDEINLFEDIPSDDLDDIDMNSDSEQDDLDDNDCPSEKQTKTQKDIMYEDFFDPPDSGDEETSEMHIEKDEDEADDLENSQNGEYDTRDYDEEVNNWDADNQDVEAREAASSSSDEDEKQAGPKTAFEIRQEKERKRILEMEESLLKPKPWQLTGEVTASNRPEDSLVHQPTTFDSNVRQDQITTDELTERVEEIVRMAINNKAWSDVERKVKPIEKAVTHFKKPIEIDQTKSKKGLAELYEDDYLKAQSKTDNDNTEEDSKHIEINKLMDQLLPELNALFAHIPKPPVPEVRVVNNLPAIVLEDVAPVGLSDATMLAPEEIKRRMSGEIKGKTERTVTDKKRERRKKKVFQKVKQKKVEEKMRELAANSPAIAKKHDKLMAIKKLKQSKNARIVTGNVSAKVKSSKDFFSRLDDLSWSKSGPKGAKKDKKLSSAKLKK